MLLRFTVANFASFRDEAELTLIAEKRHEDLAVRAVPRSRQWALPVAGVFGPNAAGKSNLSHALAFVRGAVLNSHQRWRPRAEIARRPFLLDPETVKQPSRFAVEFVAGGIRYDFGFVCDSKEFLEEWLYSYPEGRPRKVYERRAGSPIVFGPTLHGQKVQLERMLRPNSLFLSAAAANNHEQLLPVFDWFADDLRIAWEHNFEGRLRETRHYLEARESKAVLALLKYADLGVENVSFSDVKLLPEQAARIAELIRHLDSDADGVSPDGISAGMEVELSHVVGGREFKLPLELESSGTRTWLGIVGPIVSTLMGGCVLVIDELDARLHHHLSAQFIRLFQDPRTNPNGAQLLFNTHDAGLLGPEAVATLRRDQVWFSEKVDGATSLYPLMDYKVRSVENMEKRYLGGRYGGLPFFDEELLEIVASEVRAAGA
ncbi:ATP/GTP-binding protein [Streptomyces sp. ST2-7A]|uniref:AAA family ATPase n=1 Tax=Streptomyces sp. ST2-7A TaxID=2907214 RepID=UPI001F16A9A6|nr:ATP-binding protein [Streptomyces sp. ST2-7A]MCE7079836.1 ATP-binding protein [Streptomyces sp. ST2-7A]